MTSDACRELRGALGAVALGNAEEGEALALLAHLDGCAECRAELRELSSVAAALPLADPARLQGDLTQPPSALATSVIGRVMAVRDAGRARTRRRFVMAGAAALAIAAAIVGFVFVAPGHPPAGTRIRFQAAAGVSADATLKARAAGTEVAFHVAGLKPGQYYWLWLTGADEHRIAAGTFQGTAGAADIEMTAAIPLRDTRRVWVTDEHDKVVLDERLPAPA